MEHILNKEIFMALARGRTLHFVTQHNLEQNGKEQQIMTNSTIANVSTVTEN